MGANKQRSLRGPSWERGVVYISTSRDHGSAQAARGKSHHHAVICSLKEVAHVVDDPCDMRRRKRSTSESTIPKRASAAAASLQGRLRANSRTGGGGGTARNTGARKRNLSITFTQN
jgi:hypothetical protein